MENKHAQNEPSFLDLTPGDRKSLIKDFEKSLREENLRIMAVFYGIEFSDALEKYRESA